MRIFGAALAAVAVGACAPGLAIAESFQAAPGMTYTLDLDTQDGNYSVWQVHDLASQTALRSQVTFAREGKHRRWMPTFRVELKAGEDRAVIRAIAQRGRILASLRHERGTDLVEEKLFLFPPKVGETFGLEFDWSPDGQVTAVLRTSSAPDLAHGERRQVHLASSPTALRISGSTGEVRLEPLQIGVSRP